MLLIYLLRNLLIFGAPNTGKSLVVEKILDEFHTPMLRQCEKPKSPRERKILF